MIKNANVTIKLDLEDTDITTTELGDIKNLINNLLDYDSYNNGFIANRDRVGLRTDINDLLDFMNKEKVISNTVVENIDYTIYFID